MACADYELHEKLLDCAHHAGTQVQVQLDDGCSGRLCQDCFTRLGVRRWPGLAGHVAGPAEGLDVLQLLRALAPPGDPCPACGKAGLIPFGAKHRCPECGYLAPCCDPLS